jgi:hypothetical protein
MRNPLQPLNTPPTPNDMFGDEDAKILAPHKAWWALHSTPPNPNLCNLKHSKSSRGHSNMEGWE